MNFWENVKKDLEKGLKEGIQVVKESATTVKLKAEELTGEGRKRYRIYEIKTKVQKELSELGGKVYDLTGKKKNPMVDNTVKNIIERVKKLEAQIVKLESKAKTASKKKPAPKKKPVRRTAKTKKA